MNKVVLAAMASGAIVAAPTLAQAGRVYCAPGYHTGRHGNCQPNGGQVNRYCAAGYVYEPFPGGWRCVPPPSHY